MKTFDTVARKYRERITYEKTKHIQEINRQKKLSQPHSRWEAIGVTINDVLTLMEVKGKQGVFQSFNPRDFGADYDIVSIPKDGTPEADFWLTGIKYTDYQDEI